MAKPLAQTETVPANRLGQLLVEARLRKGTDLETLATKSRFTTGELSDFEAGHRTLDNNLIKKVTELYEIDCGPIVPQRDKLIIDLDDHLMTAATAALPLDSKAQSHVLDRYLSLVYLLRNSTPGTPVTLRDADLDILSASLAERRELIEEQLLLAMAPSNDEVLSLFSWFRRRLWVPAVGALVGVTSIGTLVLVAAPSSGEYVSPQQLLAEAGPDLNAELRSTPLVLPDTVTTPTPATTPDPGLTITGTTVTRPASVVASQDAPVGTFAQQLGAEAEALLPFDWEQALPGWEVNFLSENSSYRGLTYPYEQSIDLFVREGDTAESLASILAHEIGHALDVTHMRGAEREVWQEARGIEDAPWWADAYASDFQSGAGDFAEAFAYWATGDQSSSQIAGQPTDAQIDVLVSLLSDILPAT